MRRKVFTSLLLTVSLSSLQASAILEGDRNVPVEALNGMVVTSHTLATDEALKVLKMEVMQ